MRSFAVVFATFLMCACGDEMEVDDPNIGSQSFEATVTCGQAGGYGTLRYVIGRADYGDHVIDFATVPIGDGLLTCPAFQPLNIPLRPVQLPFGDAVIHLRFMGHQPPSSTCGINTVNTELLEAVGFRCPIFGVDTSCTVPPTTIRSCVSLP